MAKKTKKKFNRTTAPFKKRKQVGNPLKDSLQQNILHQAISLHQSGQLSQAETLYRKILAAEPDNPEALHFSGVLAHQMGKGQSAVELIRKALKCKPDYIEAFYNLGRILLFQGKSKEAASIYRQLIIMKPDDAQVHNNLGIALKNQGKPDEAIASFRQALTIMPEYAQAHNNLGVVLSDQGMPDQAIASFRQALALNPDYLEVYYNLGNTLKGQGKIGEAVASYRRALSLKPDYVEALNNLGTALKVQGMLDEAIDSFRQALALRPDYVYAYNNLGNAYLAKGKVEDAADNFHQALTLKPDYAEAFNNLGNAFLAQGKLDEAVADFRQALTLDPDFFEAHSDLLFCLNYLPDQSTSRYLDEARQYGQKATTKVSRRFSNWICSETPECLRVGLVSGDFCNHPVGYFLENILAHIEPNHIDLIAYPTHHKEDNLTARIRPLFTSWKPLLGINDEAAARLIHNDGIHILLDLSGHTEHNRLPVFAWKPAPVQATWLGYYASTGVAEIDYLIADSVSVPESHREQFTEQTWYLPETRLCFSPPENIEELTVSSLPALHNGYITFGCFQNLAKLNDKVLAAWSRIFQILPNARLRLQNSLFNSPAMQKQLLGRLANFGIQPERVSLEKKVPRNEYLKAHAHIDIILDTFPFPGGTTTCEAMWMGVPTITLAGHTMVARQGASLLACAGLSDWIATDTDDYVKKTAAYAADWEKLARLRAGLRQKVLASPLFDGPRFARNLETALWGMWRRFEDGQ